MRQLTVLQAYAALMLYVLERCRALPEAGEYGLLFVEMQIFFDDGVAGSFDPAMLPIFEELAGGRTILSEEEAFEVAAAFLQEQGERFESEAMHADILETVRVAHQPIVNEQRATWEACVLRILTEGIPQGVWPPPS